MKSELFFLKWFLRNDLIRIKIDSIAFSQPKRSTDIVEVKNLEQKHSKAQQNKKWEKTKKTRAKSSYGTCDEARRAKSQKIIWYEI